MDGSLEYFSYVFHAMFSYLIGTADIEKVTWVLP